MGVLGLVRGAAQHGDVRAEGRGELHPEGTVTIPHHRCQPAARIVRLITDNITHTDGQVRLLLGRQPLTVPNPWSWGNG